MLSMNVQRNINGHVAIIFVPLVNVIKKYVSSHTIIQYSPDLVKTIYYNEHTSKKKTSLAYRR